MSVRLFLCYPKTQKELFHRFLKHAPKLSCFNWISIYRRLNSLWLLDQIDQRALLASILLYEHDSNVMLENSSELEDVVVMNSLMFEKHIETLDNRLDIQVFVSTITKMAIFCSNNVEMQGKAIFPLLNQG